MFQKHLLKITLIISIIIHLLFLFSFQSLSKIQLFPIKNIIEQQETHEIEKRLEFELVETPENARSDRAPENANLLSDKNSIAKDNYQKNDKPLGSPYFEGDFDVKNLPEEKVVNAQSEFNEPANTGKRLETKDNQTSPLMETKYSYEKFSRQQLMKHQQQRQSVPQQSRNRPVYDNKKFRAEDLGGLTFNTYDWEFAPYMLAMKKKVERNIFPPPAFMYMGLISGETILKFKVMPNGEVKDLVVLKYIGHESLKETSVQAILNSTPFKPLPADFPEDYLEVTAKFSYYVNRK